MLRIRPCAIITHQAPIRPTFLNIVILRGLSQIQDPNLFHPGSEFFPPRIRVKEFKYSNPKIVSKLSEIWSRLFIPDPDPVFYPSRIQGDKKARIRIRNTGVINNFRSFCGMFLGLFTLWIVCLPKRVSKTMENKNKGKTEKISTVILGDLVI